MYRPCYVVRCQVNITEDAQRTIYGQYKCIAKNKYADVTRTVNLTRAGASSTWSR